ncbi:MAG: hypothetical protein ACR2LC_16940 [Pyrinomonadaceae bacterium]
MYKPNFCSACGEQIVRDKWRIWTSRRFCQTCAPRFRKEGVVAPIIAAAIIFSAGLAAANLARNFSNAAPPPLIVERNNDNRTMKKAGEASTPAAVSKESALSVDAEPKTIPAPNSNSGFAKAGDGATGERITDPNEIVSICGARTQKGTPCSRRVRGTGRCWQHKGLPAMLPASKLIVEG